MTDRKLGNPYVLLLLIFSGLGLWSCNDRPGNEKHQNSLTIFAASSLTDMVSEIGHSFEKNSGIAINYNFASSGTLARQIEQGAMADIFISANLAWCEHMVNKGIFKKDQLSEFAKNELVLIVPLSYDADITHLGDIEISALLQDGRMAIGDPEHVPAGIYSFQVLKALGWVGEVEESLLKTKDVRTALMLVELGEATTGIVYKTDALKSEKVRILATIPVDLHDTVTYFMVNLSRNEAADSFMEFISSEEVKMKLKSNGFKF